MLERLCITIFGYLPLVLSPYVAGGMAALEMQKLGEVEREEHRLPCGRIAITA